jgi:hypothetical protein
MGDDHRNLRAAVWTSGPVTLGADKIRVLVVEDNVAAAQALATYLSLEGWEREAHVPWNWPGTPRYDA